MTTALRIRNIPSWIQILKLLFKWQTIWRRELYVKWRFLVPAMNIRNDDNEISQESFCFCLILFLEDLELRHLTFDQTDPFLTGCDVV